MRATVLIVDDSEVARRALATRLVSHGHAVVELASATAGVAATLEGIACAVLDLELGDGDGVDVAHALRARAAGLLIAFFTGGADTELVSRARVIGPVFTKPDELDAVTEWVARAAQRSSP